MLLWRTSEHSTACFGHCKGGISGLCRIGEETRTIGNACCCTLVNNRRRLWFVLVWAQFLVLQTACRWSRNHPLVWTRVANSNAHYRLGSRHPLGVGFEVPVERSTETRRPIWRVFSRNRYVLWLRKESKHCEERTNLRQ